MNQQQQQQQMFLEQYEAQQLQQQQQQQQQSLQNQMQQQHHHHLQQQQQQQQQQQHSLQHNFSLLQSSAPVGGLQSVGIQFQNLLPPPPSQQQWQHSAPIDLVPEPPYSSPSFGDLPSGLVGGGGGGLPSGSSGSPPSLEAAASAAGAASLSSAPPVNDAIKTAIIAAHAKQEWKPKRITKNQTGSVSIRPPGGGGRGGSSSLAFRPKEELTVSWALPASAVASRPSYKGDVTDIADCLKNLNLGLFRRGVGTNQNAIITKDVLSFTVALEPSTMTFKGSVRYYAPRSPGTFVFRLFFDTSAESVYQLGTSQTMTVEVQGRDLEPNLRFILSQLKTKKTSMAALHQLGEVFKALLPTGQQHGGGGGGGRNNQQGGGGNNNNNQADFSGKAAWWCICESKKVLEQAERDNDEKDEEWNKATAEGGRDGERDAEVAGAAGGAGAARDADGNDDEDGGPGAGLEEEGGEVDDDGNGDEVGKLSSAGKADRGDDLLDKKERENRMERKKLIERKFRDTQVAVAAVLEAASNNKAVVALFRQDQLDAIRKPLASWCALSETFAPRVDVGGGVTASLSLAAHQRGALGFEAKNNPVALLSKPVMDSLSASALAIFKSSAPAQAFFDERAQVKARLEQIVKSCSALPDGTKLLVFGSSANGFGLPESDFDLCISLPPNADLEDPPAAMGKLAEDLEAAGMLAVNARLTARIPIVMFKDNVTGLECDISMQNPLAVKNTGLLSTYARVDSRVRVLAYTVKRWVKARKINSPSDGTLSSYGYILMLLHFLRTRRDPIIPNLQLLSPTWSGNAKEQSDPDKCREMMKHPTEPDYAVNGYYYSPKNDAMMSKLQSVGSSNTETAGELLASFFKYFAFEFDYRSHVVSLEGVVPKDLQGELHCWPVHNGLAIMDPFETFYNVAHVVKNNNFFKIRNEFARAYTLICDANTKDCKGLVDCICEVVAETSKSRKNSVDEAE